MNTKEFAPTRKSVSIFALMLAVACIVSIPLMFFEPTVVIPLTVLFWIGFIAYPLPKALLLAAVWVALLATMYAFSARISVGRDWKAEAFKCLLAIAVICAIADCAVAIFNSTAAVGCDKEADCMMISCFDAANHNYIYLSSVGTTSACQRLTQARCAEHKCLAIN